MLRHRVLGQEPQPETIECGLQNQFDAVKGKWALHLHDDTEPLAGGAAPSLAVAMLRAEQALRVYSGVDD